MVKRMALVLAVVSMTIGSACSSKAAAVTYAVQVDAKTDAFSLQTYAYFPSELTAHPGDTLEYTSVYRGEPHTVTFGTLVDAAISKSTENGPPPPEDKKLPNVFPDGPGDANQSAAQPCFLATGEPPASSACTADQQKPPAFDGAQTYYNAGVLLDGNTFDLKLSETIKPGKYQWMCLVHRQGMTGTLTVVADKAKADTGADVAKRKDDQLNAIVTGLQTDVTNANTNAKPGQVAAGFFDQKIHNGQPSEFLPKETTIPVGGTVSWTVMGIHTVSFDAPQSATPVIEKAPDGAFHLNAQALGPHNSPPAPGGFNGVEKPTVFDGGSYNGQGFHSTGGILAFPPGIITYKLKFTTAGTYAYKCLIHTDMEGTVKVG